MISQSLIDLIDLKDEYKKNSFQHLKDKISAKEKELESLSIKYQKEREKHRHENEAIVSKKSKGNSLCNYLAAIEYSEAQIKLEKQAGKISGYVNGSLMNQHAKSKITLKNRFEKEKKNYEGWYNKKFVSGKCKEGVYHE